MIGTLPFAAIDVCCPVMIQLILLSAVFPPDETFLLSTAEQQNGSKPDTCDSPDDENYIDESSETLRLLLRCAHNEPPLPVFYALQVHSLFYDLIALNLLPPFLPVEWP